MKKLFILAVLCLTLTGCSAKSLIGEIPAHEFKTFKYHRAGNFSSADISCLGSKRTVDGIVIDSVAIKADYGPFVNFNLTIEGYKRGHVKED